MNQTHINKIINATITNIPRPHSLHKINEKSSVETFLSFTCTICVATDEISRNKLNFVRFEIVVANSTTQPSSIAASFSHVHEGLNQSNVKFRKQEIKSSWLHSASARSHTSAVANKRKTLQVAVKPLVPAFPGNLCFSVYMPAFCLSRSLPPKTKMAALFYIF